MFVDVYIINYIIDHSCISISNTLIIHTPMNIGGCKIFFPVTVSSSNFKFGLILYLQEKKSHNRPGQRNSYVAKKSVYFYI